MQIDLSDGKPPFSLSGKQGRWTSETFQYLYVLLEWPIWPLRIKYILVLHDQHRCHTSAYLLLALERLEIVLFNSSSKKENYVEYKLTWHKEKSVKSPTSYFRLFPVNSFLFLYVVSPIIFVDISPSIFVDLHMPVTFDFGVAFICIWSLMPIFIVTKQCNFMFCTLGTVRNSYKALNFLRSQIAAKSNNFCPCRV
jgi:hypothetical protein